MAQIRRVEPKPGSAGKYVKPWEVRYSYYRNGKRHYGRERFAKKADAEVRLAEIETERTTTGIADRKRGKETFAAYADRWIEQKSQRLKPRTIEGYRLLLDRHAIPVFGDKAVTTITVAEMNDYVARLRAKGLTPASVRHAVNPVRAVLRLAVREQAIRINPAADLELPTNNTTGRPEFKPVVLSPDNVAALVIAAEDQAQHETDAIVDALVLRVLAFAGLRTAELAGLLCADFRYNTAKRCDSLLVERTVRKVKGGVEVGTPKSAASTRDVELPPSLAAAIRDYLANVHPDPRPDAPMFPGRRNGGLHDTSLSALDWDKPWDRDAFSKRVLKPALLRAGLPSRTRLHDLRHFSCSNSVESGQSVNRVAQRHGHADPAFTSRRYVHPFDESAADDMAALDTSARRTLLRPAGNVVSLTDRRASHA
jgi:integrase